MLARTAALVAIMVAMPVAAAAPQADVQRASHPLLLGDLFNEVKRENPRSAAARALARAADARTPGARRPPDPQLQLGFMNYEVPGLRPMDPLGMTQLQLMQMVPTAGKLGLAGRESAARAAGAALRAADVEWDVRSQAAMVFYEIYQVEQRLAVERETLRLLEDTREITEAMYRVGEGRQADVLRSQVEIARMTEDTIRMTTMRAAMAARLRALLNRMGDDDFGDAVLPLFPDSVPALAELEAQADANRPMVNAGRREVEAAGAQVELARRELWPDLTLGLQLGQRASPDGMGTERMGSLMVGASLPIFARSRQLRMREEAVAMRQMAEADLAAMRADTRARVAEQRANLTRARRLASLYRTTILPQANAVVASSLAAYRAGSVDFMTLLDNRMRLNGYREELAVLEADEGRSWAELEMLTGRELLDAGRTRAQVGVAPGGGRDR
jgi:outer membrane protein TolC